jgi:hypothetical protein
MSVLSRADILAAPDRPITRLQVPEWGGDLYFRPLSVAQAQRVSAAAEGLSAAVAVAAAVCGEDGTPIFTEADVPALAERNATVVARIATTILAHSRPKGAPAGN